MKAGPESSHATVTKWIAVFVLLALSVGFSWLFYTRYGVWRDCIAQAASSCVTPEGDTLIVGGVVWSVIALACFAGAIILAWKRR